MTCGYTNGCGQVCYQGSGCTPACNNSCYGVTCGYANGCGQTCYQGSGCSVAATPQITGMQDASTYQSNQATRGGYISVYGYNLNSCTQAYLGGYQSITGIYPSGGGQQVNAYIDWYSTSPGWQALYLLCDGSWTSWSQSVWVN